LYGTGGVPKAWVGWRVRARIKTRRGGEYLVVDGLADVDDEGIHLFGGEAHGTKAGRSEITRAYPWASLVNAQPSKVG